MIGFLRGALRHLEPDRVLLDVGGVGYDVQVPLSTYYELDKLGAGSEAELYIHTHVRDDALLLYGFSTDLERQLFLKLIAVSGIGPRLAQTILSGMAPEELITALVASDLPRLNRIPGVGKKTAERLVLELRDRVKDLGQGSDAAAVTPAGAPRDEDLVSALVHLGYKRAAAERALLRVDAALPFADKLRAALSQLSRA